MIRDTVDQHVQRIAPTFGGGTPGITFWMCPNGHPGGWSHARCDQCEERYTRGAYSWLPHCPWCVGQRPPHQHWRTYSDGITRPCACGSYEPGAPPLPDPLLMDRLAAFTLWSLLEDP